MLEKDEILPWLNDKTIEFLKSFLTKEMKVFEFGAGRSTIFFANLAGQIISVESRAQWVDYVKSFNLSNSIVIVEQKQFASAINQFHDNIFDLILIDSNDRVNCLKNSFNKITKNGVILVDNCESEKLCAAVLDFASQNNFNPLILKGFREN